MKQICSQKSYKADRIDWTALRTKISRAAFVSGLALMALTCCMVDVALATMAATGIAGAALTLVSMRWTGWGDWVTEDEEMNE